MNTQSHKSILLTFIIGIACTLLLSSLVNPSLALPPRPPTPTPIPVSRPSSLPAPSGTQIQLHARFSPEWADTGIPWQDLWTVVQWQDYQGSWHTVEGWQGELDEVVDGEGWKMWWLDKDLFYLGPFRWLVLYGYGGEPVTQGQPFYMPTRAHEIMTVEVLLQPCSVIRSDPERSGREKRTH